MQFTVAGEFYTGGEPVHFVVGGQTMMIRMAHDDLNDCYKAAVALGACAFVRLVEGGIGVYLLRDYNPKGKVTSAVPDKFFEHRSVDGAVMWALMRGKKR